MPHCPVRFLTPQLGNMASAERAYELLVLRRPHEARVARPSRMLCTARLPDRVARSFCWRCGR